MTLLSHNEAKGPETKTTRMFHQCGGTGAKSRLRLQLVCACVQEIRTGFIPADRRKLEETCTHKSAKTHAGNVFVTRDLTFDFLTRR